MKTLWNLILLVVGVLVASAISVGIASLPLFIDSYDVIYKWLPDSKDSLDASKAGQFGDFVGGFIGTIMFTLSVIILLYTYWNQRDANQKTAFESRFFELLKYHRENLTDIEIDGKKGQRAFVSLIREFRMSLNIVRSACVNLDLQCSQKQMIDLAYMAFYYGVGPNSSRVLEKSVAGAHSSALVKLVVEKMSNLQEAYSKSKDEAQLTYFWTMQVAGYERGRIHYCPFDGHQSRLAHYYRHLWQMMKYVHEHRHEVKAQEYAGIVRAQLSNHEQALLCLNALASIGAAWRDKKRGCFSQKGLLTKYELIKNIPEDFFNHETELTLKTEFPKVRFEFEDIKDRHGDGPNRDSVSSDE